MEDAFLENIQGEYERDLETQREERSERSVRAKSSRTSRTSAVKPKVNKNPLKLATFIDMEEFPEGITAAWVPRYEKGQEVDEYMHDAYERGYVCVKPEEYKTANLPDEAYEKLKSLKGSEVLSKGMILMKRPKHIENDERRHQVGKARFQQKKAGASAYSAGNVKLHLVNGYNQMDDYFKDE